MPVQSLSFFASFRRAKDELLVHHLTDSFVVFKVFARTPEQGCPTLKLLERNESLQVLSSGGFIFAAQRKLKRLLKWPLEK